MSGGAPFEVTDRPKVALATLAGFIEVYFTDDAGRPLRLSAGQRYACQTIERGVFSGEHLGSGLEMARGHGKSMIMKAMVIRAFLLSFYGDGWGSRYAAILTNGTLYKQFSRDIGDIVTGVGAPLTKDSDGHPLLLKDFWINPGYLHPNKKTKERQLWNVADKLIYVGNWEHPCRLSVRGMTGGRGDVRGLTQGNQRPDLLIVDDPMKEGEADNEETTGNVKLFIKKSFIPCGAPNARIAMFGTPFNNKDLITEVCGNAVEKPLQSEWPGIVSVCLPAMHPKNGALLCPGIWTREKLEERRSLLGSRAFAQEYLLDPQGGGVRHFEPAWIAKWTLPAPAQTPDRRRLKRYMYLDPSLGRTTKSDYSAIIIIDHEPAANVWWVIHADIQRRRPQKLVTDYLDLWQRFQPDTHATEDEGAQELLLPIFAAEVAARKLPAIATPRLQSSGGVSKVQRIKRLSPMCEFGQLRWDANGSHKELRTQLTGWQGLPNETDDGPDALEGCVRLSSRSPTITAAAFESQNR